MTKKRILEYLLDVEWDEGLLSRLTAAVAKYVVYQEDPVYWDTYAVEYHLTLEEARKDYENRPFVGSGRWCSCVLESFEDEGLCESRKIFAPSSL